MQAIETDTSRIIALPSWPAGPAPGVRAVAIVSTARAAPHKVAAVMLTPEQAEALAVQLQDAARVAREVAK